MTWPTTLTVVAEAFAEGDLRLNGGEQDSTSLPARVLSGRWWHQNAPRYALLSCPDPTTVDARYQRRSDPGVCGTRRHASAAHGPSWHDMPQRLR